jgi:hypothetical protein
LCSATFYQHITLLKDISKFTEYTGDEGKRKYYDEHSRVLSMKKVLWPQ